MKKKLNIVIIHGNSQGLLNDAVILQHAFHQSKDVKSVVRLSKFNALLKNVCDFTWLFLKSLSPGNKLIIVHLEEIHREFIHFSDTHLLFPNQEWFRSDTAQSLQKFKNKFTVCCKTRYARKLFSNLTDKVVFTGFNSIDKYLPEVEKEPLSFLHIAGKSEQKGTNSLIQAWLAHPEWPKLTIISRRDEHSDIDALNLTIISHFMSEEALLLQMNKHPVHLCPSESEGFGHTIWEGYSTNALVITTDAPPMSEFPPAGQALSFACKPYDKRYLSELFKVSKQDVEKTITTLLENKPPFYCTKSTNTEYRNHYEQNSRQFEERIKALTASID